MENNTNKKYLVTSALPYANWPLHVWHVAGVHLPADIYYRFLKMMGEDCTSLCWTDEHGVGIEIAAQKKWVSEKELVTLYKEEIFSTLKKIWINYDIIEGTSTNEHMELSQEFFNTLLKNGYIEKRNEQQMFCGNCDRFLPDRYIEGTCPSCWSEWARWDQCEKCSTLLDPIQLLDPCCKICNNHDVIAKETYNYYFLLSKLESTLDKRIEEKDFKKNVKSTAKKWINEWLSDRSISRDIKRGIPIPWDVDKKMYVRFEAPISYISFLKDKVSQFRWKDTESKIVHFLWKDNIPFHTIMWPAILLAHWGYKLPDDVVGNEFLNLEWNKISTSRDHAVWLHDIVENFNQDYIRNYLIQCIPETKDSNFSREDFKEKSDTIADSLWNLLNRVNTFYTRHFEWKTKWTDDTDETKEYMNLDMNLVKDSTIELMNKYKIRDAFSLIMQTIKELNRFLANTKPWNVIKTDREKTYAIINITSEYLINIAILLHPFLPQTAEKIMKNYDMDIRQYTYADVWNIQLWCKDIQDNWYIFKKISDEEIKSEIHKLLK